jgi:hypothetical protein
LYYCMNHLYVSFIIGFFLAFRSQKAKKKILPTKGLKI